jgi:hypothetical protein
MGARHDRHAQLPACRDPQLLQLRGGQDPEYVAQCAEVLTVPLKREPTSAPCYLEPAEVEAIAQPDRTTVEGMRDHVALVPVQQRRAYPGSA